MSNETLGRWGGGGGGELLGTLEGQTATTLFKIQVP